MAPRGAPSDPAIPPFSTRTHVGIHREHVSDVSSQDYPGMYPDEDHAWNLEKFKKGMSVRVTRISNRSIDFDLAGVDASIANAFRRILIAEVPTVCIERVYVFNNTSVIQDEVLSSRIGLVPLNVDPSLIDWSPPGAGPTDQNTLVFTLNVTCTRAPVANQQKGKKKTTTTTANAPSEAESSSSPSTTTNNSPYINEYVYSGDLKWRPEGDQPTMLTDPVPSVLNPNIVLAKLRPGQDISMECHAIKGVGMDHAKFSPVATASYRILPTVHILKPIPPEHADKFAKCFSPGVIRVDPQTKAVSVDPVGVRNDTVSREVLRHPEFEGMVQLGRKRDIFLFNIESESAYKPERLLPEAIKVMRNKIATIRTAAQALVVDASAASSSGKASDGDVEMAAP